MATRFTSTLDEARTRAAAAGWENPGFQCLSPWIAALLLEYERTVGFPYNAAFQRWLEKREGWPASDESGSPLSTLIYNAQRHNEDTAPARAGYLPLTPEMLAQARRARLPLLIWGGMLGDIECRPGAADGGPVAFIGRSRTRYYALGTPARIARTVAPAVSMPAVVIHRGPAFAALLAA